MRGKVMPNFCACTTSKWQAHRYADICTSNVIAKIVLNKRKDKWLDNSSLNSEVSNFMKIRYAVLDLLYAYGLTDSYFDRHFAGLRTRSREENFDGINYSRLTSCQIRTCNFPFPPRDINFVWNVKFFRQYEGWNFNGDNYLFTTHTK